MRLFRNLHECYYETRSIQNSLLYVYIHKPKNQQLAKIHQVFFNHMAFKSQL